MYQENILVVNKDKDLIYFDLKEGNRRRLLSNVKKISYSLNGYNHFLALCYDDNLFELGNGYFKEITNEFNSSVNPVKIAENIKDMACGDKFIAVIDNNSNIIVNGYFSLGTYITEQSTQYYENQLVKTESTEGNAMKIFACQTNIFVVFEDDACIAWGENYSDQIGKKPGYYYPISEIQTDIDDKVIKADGYFFTWQ